jgi:hypothetical protein
MEGSDRIKRDMGQVYVRCHFLTPPQSIDKYTGRVTALVCCEAQVGTYVAETWGNSKFRHYWTCQTLFQEIAVFSFFMYAQTFDYIWAICLWSALTYTNGSLFYFPFSNTQFLCKFLQLQKSWRWVRIKLYIRTLLAGCHAAALTQGWLSVWRWEVPWYLFVCSYIGCAIVFIMIISINLPSYTLDCMVQPWRPAKTMTELD